MKKSVPKLFRNKDKQMDLFQIIADQRETNKFDIEKATKKSGKNEGLFYFWNDGKIEGIRSKKKTRI